MTVDTSDLQGMVLGNIAGYRLVRHFIFSAPDAASLRRFVQEIRPLILFGTNKPTAAHGWVANISFAARAMAQLLPADVYAKLESAYRSPPDAERIGDVGASAPSQWWEGRFRGEEVSCFVHLHAIGDAQLAAGTAEILEEAAAAGLGEKIPRASAGRLDGAFLGFGPAGKGARLHFGYVDGLSNGKIAWDGAPSPERPIDPRSVVIGHYDDRFPCAPAREPAASILRDSSYLVFRWIYQDAATFERFLTAKGPPLFPGLPPAEARELLAAKIMGRWRDGTPLCLAPESPAPDRCEEGFAYAGDLQGLACPVSSHVRVMNPRDQALSGMAATTGVPQIVRRGMPYGAELSGDTDDGVDRGILGIFVCASIREQFMRLAAWGQRNNFSDSFPAHGRDQDALIGNRAVPGATREFRIPKGPAGGGVVTGLPDFIRTKGTQYLLMPSGQTLSRLVPM
jgi:Dyp-type peroxidase family